MKIRMVLSLPIPRGPGASPLHCLPSCFCVSLWHFCSCFLLSTLPLLPFFLYLFHFYLFFSSPLATHEAFCGFILEDLSGAISPLVNKCCDRRQVGETLMPDERTEHPGISPAAMSHGLFSSVAVSFSLSLCVCVCMLLCECH